MQAELTSLQPELIKTSEETDKIMVKIEHDSVEVEAKKEVCFCIERSFPRQTSLSINLQYF